MEISMSEDAEEFPGRLLHQAALWDNAELLEDLLHADQLRHINSLDSWGRTPLHAAATTEGSSCLRILLQSGADPNIPCGPRGEYRTALHVSAEHGHGENIRLLLEHGALLELRDGLGLLPVDLAVKGGHTECVSVLRTALASQEAVRLEAFTALHEALCHPSLLEKLMLEYPDELPHIINMAPNGANTLLFKACEAGQCESVKHLLDHGADCRLHPVTKYSPLYIACYYGRKDVVDLLLKRFPDLVQVSTVEKWLPIHACCINGHLSTLELILRYPYPPRLLHKYTDPTGQWEYELAFDVNSRDMSGQTALYMATCTKHHPMVDAMLKFKVRAKSTTSPSSASSTLTPNLSAQTPTDSSSPTKRRIASGIQALMARLHGSVNGNAADSCTGPGQTWLSPWDVDVYCGPQTALHVAVLGRQLHTVSLLLVSGANPNLPINYEDKSASTCLVESVKLRDLSMIELLLKYGAKDPNAHALQLAVSARDDIVVAKLLALLAHSDPDFKINKRAGSPLNESRGGPTLLFPSQSVMVNWHGLKHLEYLQPGFLVDAAVAVNTKLKLTPRTQPLALHVITRIDISNNVLIEVPLLLFQLHSLRYLNLAQNKLAKLPTPTNSPIQAPPSSAQYQCPVLEELHLQDNRLDELPEEIFALPSLTLLDVSNNKLQVLPKAIWTAPKLKELNASFNLLKSLPSSQDCAEASKVRFDLSIPLGSGRLGLDLLGEDGDSSEEGDARMMRSLQISASNLNAHVLVHPSIWRRTVDVQAGLPLEASTEGRFPLAHLNLAHNAFTELPPCLSCLGVTLTRLNLSYNQLTELNAPSDYPAGLKHLDLSHNQISQWTWESTNTNLSVCYATNEEIVRTPVTPGRKLSTKPRAPVMCAHKQHGRLEALKTLVLADNLLTNLQLSGEEDSTHSTWEDVTSTEDIATEKSGRSRLLFPNLSMLDLSNNKLKEVPSGLPELSNLSVLNLAGNTDITDLPSNLGLLTRLWNLNTKGCNLQEPLKSMVASPRYKTSDIIGYLRSVLEEAKPYARLKLMLVGLQGIGKTTLLEALRSEGMGRRKPPEHWAKRMGHKSIGKTNRGTILSTVGVDIGDWIYEKKLRGQSPGPVIFRTWDFGGQKEYYATHQYFLSRRSLYLVVWKMTDGEKGVNDIHQWLVNIQVRAPNSPVIIVGTHSDLVQDPGYVEELQQLIRDRFINVVDAEKLGLPRVLDTVPVSAKTRYNIKTLCSIIYDTAHSLKLPGSKERLLEQKIPASYLALEDVVCHLSTERRMAGLDPVLNADEYRTSVTLTMQSRHKRSFRDIAELNQATAFLHDNGVLLHYEDATLKDLYFLDPQWLCDMLAHVVTIREINPFARSGIMKLDDLKLLFRWSSATGGAIDARTYVISLLNKFEVALTWDNRSLLIPSLLPSEEQLLNNAVSEVSIPIPVRSRGRSRLPRYSSTASDPSSLPTRPHRAKSAHPIIQSISRPLLSEPKPAPPPYQIEFRSNAEAGLYRMFLLSYLPSGFWSRFMTRLLAHDVIIDTLRHYFTFPKELSSDPLLSASLEWRAEWKLWQTGLELMYLGAVLLRIKETAMPFSLPTNGKLYARQEGVWMPVDRLQGQVCIEVMLPGGSLVARKPLDGGYQALAVEPNLESMTRLLAVATDHLDTLLEDWYPTLGTRFVHTSEGKFLVNRLVPCPRCLWAEEEPVREEEEDVMPPPVSPVSRSPRRSRGSVSGDSGVGQESPASSRMASMEGIREERYEDNRSPESPLYTFSIEECILAAHESVPLRCPLHRDIQLALIAPDVAFLDLGDRYLVKPDNVKKGELLGRGAFGFVFRATCKLRGSDDNRQVALKMLQPVDPGAEARSSAVAAYKAAVTKWERDSLQQSCKAYCTARQEVSMLMSLRHPYVVSFLGLLPHPLALVLEVAPLGALDHHLKHYRRSGAKLSHYTIQIIILQLGKSLEYLHQNHVIYRDLKSENVLVWQLPSPGTNTELASDVLVKLGDYGISRVALPSGTKGFGGTEGFMAPEMVRYNGEEEYTSQVDIFSFGMLLYELFTLRQPFQGYDAVKEVVLEGGRPPLTEKDTVYPVSMLDLMALCWSQSPKDRPSASHIVSVASAPEFTHLLDGVLLSQCQELVVAVTRALHYPENVGGVCWEIWLGGQSPRVDLLLSEPGSILEHHSLAIDTCGPPITAACVVGEDAIWLGDSLGQIHAFCTKSYRCLFRYLLEDSSSPVKSLIALPSLGRVAAALGNGRIFLCRSDVIPSTPTGGEGTFLITELGTPTSGESNEDVRCMAAVARRESLELWCGQSEANICIFVLKNGIVTSQEVVSHFPSSLAPLQVLHVTAAPLCDKTERLEHQVEISDDDDDGAEDEEGVAVWSYVHPGCVVYRWNVAQREVVHRLDCSKLAPCSESLQSISIEEHLSPGRCQVRSLCVLYHLVYIGTTWGCLVVADAATLRPVTVCRPYEADLRLILPLIDTRDNHEHHVMTVGRGYRSLLTRFVGTPTSDSSNLAPLRKPCHALLWSTNPWD